MTSDKKTFSTRDLLVYGISVLVAGLFLYLAFSGIDTDDFIRQITHVSVPWLLVFSFLLFFSHWARAYRWKVILGELGKDVPTLNLFGAVVIGYGLNNVISRLGEVARAVSVAKTDNVSASSVIGTVVVERSIDILLFALAVLISAVLYGSTIFDKFPWLMPTIIIGFVFFLILLLVFILTIRMKERFTRILVKVISIAAPVFAIKVGHLFERIIEGFGSLKGAKNYTKVLLSSAVIMLTYAAGSYICFYVMRFDEIPAYESVITFGTAWILLSISSISMMIPTPGGIGAYHAITKSVLVLLFGFQGSHAIAYATLNHGVSYILHILVTIGFFIYFRNRYEGFRVSSLLTLKTGREQV